MTSMWSTSISDFGMTSMEADPVLRNERGDAVCPDHGDSLGYHEDQGDEFERREHLVCTEPGCGFEVWA